MQQSQLSAEWIKAGVPYGEAARSRDEQRGRRQPSTGPSARPCVRASPQLKTRSWSRNPIDAFIAAEHAETRNHTAAGGRQTHADPPSLSRPDRVCRQRRKTSAAFVDDKNPRRLREDRRPASRQPTVWRALGPPLARYLALLRLVRLAHSEPGSLLAAAHLALAGLDDRIAEPEQAVRPDDCRDARRRRSRSRQIPMSSAPPDILARNWYMFNRNVWLQDTVDYTVGSVSRADDEVRALPHAQIRSDSARRLLPVPGVLRAARCADRSRCPVRPTR